MDVDVKAGFLSDIYLYVVGSSYIEHKNEEFKKMKKRRNEDVIQPASQNINTSTPDSVSIQKITLPRGDSIQLGDYRFIFQDYRPVNPARLPDSISITLAVHALIDVQYKASNDPYQLRPLFAVYSDGEKSWSYSPPVEPPEHNIDVQFSSINPETGKIEFTVKGISEKPGDEWILLMAEEKPFTSLVWLGTFVLMAGFSVSIFRHWNGDQKNKSFT